MTGYPPVGIDEIDSEHAVFESVLRFLVAAAAEKDAARAAPLFAALLVRAGGHFAHEERLMREFAYPGRERHAATHRAFLADAAAFHQELCESGFTPGVIAFIDVAPSWFVHHVAEEDLPLGAAIAASRAEI